jgi:membrane protease YdiL (CAAX protease family)
MSSPEVLTFSIAILWCVAGYGSYYALGRNRKLLKLFGTPCKLLDSQGNQVLLQRVLGFLILGLSSALIIVFLPDRSPGDYGLNFRFTAPPSWWSWLLFPLALILSYMTARTPANLQQYPQIRTHAWTPAMLSVSGISWVLFLVGYEFLFRGFVFFASMEIMGPAAAVVLNIALYAAAHFHKGPAEILGSIPVGILFCYLTLLTGNIWTAVILHAVMALSNEWFSLRAHPEMSLSKVR